MRLPNQSHLIAHVRPNFLYVKTFFSDLGGYFTRIFDFTWRESDCKELVARPESKN